MIYVSFYLLAIVLANLLFAAALNPASGYSLSTQLIADFAICFSLIGFDMALRDKLHDAWQHQRLWLKMSGLIIAGSALSYAMSYWLNQEASDIVARVALASFLAFSASGFTDFVIYHALKGRSKLLQINGSNVPSALIDSLVFPLVAFGLPMMWPFFLVEFAAKVLGGAFWSLLLIKKGFFHPSDSVAASSN